MQRMCAYKCYSGRYHDFCLYKILSLFCTTNNKQINDDEKKQTNKQVLIFGSECVANTNCYYYCFNITLNGYGVTERFPHENEYDLQLICIYNI